MSVIQGAQLESYITSLSLNDLNRILFRCDGEERDDGKGFGAYNLAFYGDTKYCGLQGKLSSVFNLSLFFETVDEVKFRYAKSLRQKSKTQVWSKTQLKTELDLATKTYS